MEKLKDTILNGQWVGEETEREVRKHFLRYFLLIKEIKEMIKDEDAAYQTLWNVGKATFRGKFIAINAYIKTEE